MAHYKFEAAARELIARAMNAPLGEMDDAVALYLERFATHVGFELNRTLFNTSRPHLTATSILYGVEDTETVFRDQKRPRFDTSQLTLQCPRCREMYQAWHSHLCSAMLQTPQESTHE